MAKFPRLIHVTEEGDGDDKYFQVHAEGVAYMDTPNQPVAIYQLVKVGRVDIQKTFKEQGGKSR